MKKSRGKCGHCARTYSKPIWKNKKIWCQQCKIYVCRDCAEGFYDNPLCPECGNKLSNLMQQAFFGSLIMSLSLISGSIFLLSWVIYKDMDFRDVVPEIVVISIYVLAPLIGTYVSWRILRNHERDHNERIERLPKGPIPVEKRPGHGNLILKRKIEKATQQRGLFGLEGPYTDTAFVGLKGLWDCPIVSLEERNAMALKQKKTLIIAIVATVFGVALIIITFLGIVQFPLDAITGAIGAIISFLALTIISFKITILRKVNPDTPIKSKAQWKTVGLDDTKTAIEGFLKKNEMEYRKKVRLMAGGYSEHRYILNNGNQIISIYVDNWQSYISGYLTVQYTPSNYLHAKKLQKTLDDYLTDKDLIIRKEKRLEIDKTSK